MPASRASTRVTSNPIRFAHKKSEIVGRNVVKNKPSTRLLNCCMMNSANQAIAIRIDPANGSWERIRLRTKASDNPATQIDSTDRINTWLIRANSRKVCKMVKIKEKSSMRPT